MRFFTHWFKVPVLLLLLCAMPQTSFAAPAPSTTPPVAVPHGTCTTDPQFEITTPPPGQGLISTIIDQIQDILEDVSEELFSNIVTDTGFIKTVQAMATLYIAFYGILFMFGMVQITYYDFGIRMIKIGVLMLLLSPSAWDFFNDTVVTFFNAGTDDWINGVSAAVLQQPLPGNAPPFYVIETALSKALSAKMAVTMMAMFFTPPYGPVFGLLLALGLSTFVRAVLTAAWVYLMSLILKALLFGIAPIFLSCLLFVRTRYLFDGWLNQIVNATLQPILLFTFLAFFVQLLGVAIENVLTVPVCWTEWSEGPRGTTGQFFSWRYTLCSLTDPNNCNPYGGNWAMNGPQTGSGPIFPIDIIGILVIVMLADLASRFNSIVILIASDLASASAGLASMSGASLGDMFKKANAQNNSPNGSAVAQTGLPNQRAPGVGNRQGPNQPGAGGGGAGGAGGGGGVIPNGRGGIPGN